METELDRAVYALAISQAVDRYRDMEKKAAAWDELRRLISQSREPIAPTVLELMDSIVHPAQNPSS